MIIRKALPADLDTLVDFQLVMAMESENLQLDKRVLAQGIQNVLTDPHKGTIYVTEDNGRLVGTLMVTLEWSDWRNGWVWWIMSLYVVPEYRKKGVFRTMYLYLQDLVQKSPDVRGIRLYVDKTNLRAQKVYDAIGMSGEHYTTYEWLKE